MADADYHDECFAKREAQANSHEPSKKRKSELEDGVSEAGLPESISSETLEEIRVGAGESDLSTYTYVDEVGFLVPITPIVFDNVLFQIHPVSGLVFSERRLIRDTEYL